MSKNPLVTIGMPMYNSEKFITQAIISTLQQTFTDFELIITDDGSTDRSIELVKSFEDPRIKLLSDGTNKGISYRLNQQVDMATGKYYLRMDSDDIMFPNRIEEQVKYLEAHPELDVVGTSAVIIDNENKIIGYRETSVPKDEKEAIKVNVFIHPTVCGKLSWFKNLPYNGKFNGSEDFDVWLRGYPYSKYFVSKEPLLFYRDPLEFKIKTYVDRLKKQRLMLNNAAYLKERFLVKNKMLLSLFFKGFIAQFLHKVGKDQILIARRNNELNNLSHYENVLNQILINHDKDI